MNVRADGESDGFSGGDGALGQVGGEAKRLAVMAGAGGGGQLRRSPPKPPSIRKDLRDATGRTRDEYVKAGAAGRPELQ